MKKTECSPLILVTGAFGIICPIIIRKLREKGWRVAATGRNEKGLTMYNKAAETPLEAEGIFYADLSSQKVCRELVQQVEAELGPIYGIINGAAWNPRDVFTELDEETMNSALTTNFAAPVYLVQAAYHSLIQQKGSVVNLSSVLVNEPRRENLIYQCSKAALEKSTEAMATEFIGTGVRVNTIRIGRVPGIAFMRETLSQLPEPQAKRMARELHRQRLDGMRASEGEHAIGTPEDIAAGICFLMSPESRFINGQTLVMDGGHGLEARSSGAKVTASTDKIIADWISENITKSEI